MLVDTQYNLVPVEHFPSILEEIPPPPKILSKPQQNTRIKVFKFTSLMNSEVKRHFSWLVIQHKKHTALTAQTLDIYI